MPSTQRPRPYLPTRVICVVPRRGFCPLSLGILDVLLSSRARRYTSALDAASEMYASPHFLECSRRARDDLMLPVRSRLLRHPSAYKQCAADFPLSIHEVAPAVDTIRRLAFSCLGARTSQLAAAYFFGPFEHLAQYSLGTYICCSRNRPTTWMRSRRHVLASYFHSCAQPLLLIIGYKLAPL